MSLRYRLWLSFLPLILLFSAIGAGGVYALSLLGERIDDILKENYLSVDAMIGLNEALERIDSSFSLSLADHPDAQQQYEEGWKAYLQNYDFERKNITEPGEDELVTRLSKLTEQYELLGDQFYKPQETQNRKTSYYGQEGKPGPLREVFAEIKDVTAGIRRVNQNSMERASENARKTATSVRWWTVILLAIGLGSTGLLALWTTRAILRPLDDLTRSAIAVGNGKFDQLVTTETTDEIGELVTAFNRMTAQLRDLRQSQTARLLRAQQASQSAIDAFPDPVLLIDPNGSVELANPAARKVLGVSPSNDVAQRWQPPETLRAHLAYALQEQQSFLTRSFEQAITYRSEGAERVYLPQILPVCDQYGATLGAVIVLNDVTQFRLLDEFKSDLVATTSHEFKTPLAGLRLAVHLLLEETVGPLTNKQTELLIDARDNTDRLVRIVDHLLSLAQLEQQGDQLSVRPENPMEILRAAAERIQPIIYEREVKIEAPGETLPSVAIDSQRLGQALDNLLVNAATYTNPGGKIILSAQVVQDNKVQLVIRDTGVGIAPEFLPRVFDKFFRVTGQTRGQGTGLGLAIVKEIVTAHNGTITCESTPNVGTTFRLTLPIWDNPSIGETAS